MQPRRAAIPKWKSLSSNTPRSSRNLWPRLGSPRCFDGDAAPGSSSRGQCLGQLRFPHGLQVQPGATPFAPRKVGFHGPPLLTISRPSFSSQIFCTNITDFPSTKCNNRSLIGAAKRVPVANDESARLPQNHLSVLLQFEAASGRDPERSRRGEPAAEILTLSEAEGEGSGT
jgi:hypothetical protein